MRPTVCVIVPEGVLPEQGAHAIPPTQLRFGDCSTGGSPGARPGRDNALLPEPTSAFSKVLAPVDMAMMSADITASRVFCDVLPFVVRLD